MGGEDSVEGVGEAVQRAMPGVAGGERDLARVQVGAADFDLVVGDRVAPLDSTPCQANPNLPMNTATKKKGPSMKPTERIASLFITSIKGTLATFCDRMHIKGTSASKTKLLVTLTAITTFFAFTGTALAAAPTVVSESTSPTTKPSEELRLEATVNAGEEAAGVTTECHFQYGKTSVTEHEEECAQGNALEGGELGVSVNVKGLHAGTTYIYRVVLKNTSG